MIAYTPRNAFDIPDCQRDFDFDQEVGRLSEQDVIVPNGETILKAARRMKNADMRIRDALHHLETAVEILNDFPEGDRVSSMMNTLDDFHCDLKELIEAFRKGANL